jgi:MFS transporter, OFA family, oxalate/formate antiporter
MTIAAGASARPLATEATRWGQLIFGIICMVMIANLQYGWTLFVNPIDQKYHWGRAAIQVAFTIFVLTETWLVPFEGYLNAGRGAVVTRRGAPRCDDDA